MFHFFSAVLFCLNWHRFKDVTLKELLKKVFWYSSGPLSTEATSAEHFSDPKMDWALCLYVCFFLGLSILALKLRLRKSVHGLRELPCLPCFPFIGSLLSLRSVHPPHVLFKKLQEKYGQTYSLMMGSHRVIIVNHYSHAKEVLLKKGKIFAGRPRTVGAPSLLSVHDVLLKK